MARQDTQLQAAGAEFLVLGQLLCDGIPAFKSYTNMKGYDLVTVNPERNISARVQVKSRWKTKADGFFIGNFDCDFVVIALLNRGSKDGKVKTSAPEFFVLPVEVVKKLPRSDINKVRFTKFPDRETYRDRWDLIRTFLRIGDEDNVSRIEK